MARRFLICVSGTSSLLVIRMGSWSFGLYGYPRAEKKNDITQSSQVRKQPNSAAISSSMISVNTTNLGRYKSLDCQLQNIDRDGCVVSPRKDDGSQLQLWPAMLYESLSRYSPGN